MPLPGMAMTPAAMGGPDASPDAALSAMGGLTPRSPNPTVAVQKIREGLDMIEQLCNAIIPQVSQMNPKVAKDLHAIGQRVIAAKSELVKDQPLPPPPDLMAGMGPGGPPSPGPVPGMGM